MVTLVTGGSGSGKSDYAEQEIVKLGDRRRIYIATMMPWDEECRLRIKRHRAMRAGRQFETVECCRSLERLELPPGAFRNAVLLECLSNLVSNELFGTGEENCPDSISAEYGSAVADAVVNGIMSLKNKAADVMIVTNEVFSDGDYRGGPAAARESGSEEKPEDGGEGKPEGGGEEKPEGGGFNGWKDSTALYLKVLGEVNCRLGAAADRIIEVTAGIPVVIKEEPGRRTAREGGGKI